MLSRVRASRRVDDRAPPLDRARLATLEPSRRIPGRNRTKADIVVYRIDGVDVAVKDYRARPFAMRQTLGRLQVRWESAAYRAAHGISGLPRFRGRVDAFALATEWIDGRPLSELQPGEVDPSCFDDLGRLLEALHAQGIALSDLHHRDVLLDRDGTIWVLDLATAWTLGRRPGRMRQRLFRRLCELDRLALARMRARFGGGDPERAVDEFGGPVAAWHRRGRRLKHWLNRLRGKSRR